jgi:hypothetical protein
MPADAWLVESITPLGHTDDGQPLVLISLLIPTAHLAEHTPASTRAGPYAAPKTHTRVFYIGQPPLGLASEAQTADMMVALYKNRTALGTAGEKILERLLKNSGHIIIKGPIANAGVHHADIVSYDGKKLHFFDNKVQTTKATVSSANNLTENRLKTIDDAIAKLATADHIEPSMRRKILKELRSARRYPDRAQWLIGNAAPEGIANVASRVSIRLARNGVRLADIVGDTVVIKSLARSIDGVRGASKHLGKLSKGAAPGILSVSIAVGMGAPRLAEAAAEDAYYQQIMNMCGEDARFAGQSVARELAVIAGEESASEAGAWVGGIGGAWLAGWGAIPGAAIGGIVGDYAGGGYAGWQFDRAVTISEDELMVPYR